VAGSVAEFPWTESVVKSFLKDIPNNKLILGIPFYTRLWMESTGKDGGIKLDSKALSMESARKFLKENKAEVVWDDLTGQFKSQFEKDGTTYKVWLENDDSVNLRTSLVLKYELAGTAAWRLDFEEPDVWKDIMGNLKTIVSYDGWKKVNSGRINSY
jgi:spore germination protein YaaH